MFNPLVSKRIANGVMTGLLSSNWVLVYLLMFELEKNRFDQKKSHGLGQVQTKIVTFTFKNIFHLIFNFLL